MQRFGDGGSVQEQAPSVTAVGHWVPSLGLPVPSSEGKIFWTHIMQQCTARSWPQEGDLEKFSGGPPDKRARGGNAAESGAPYPGHLQHLVSPRWWRGLPCASHAVPRCPSPLYSRDNLRGARVRRQRVSYPRRRRCRPYGTRPWARQSDPTSVELRGLYFFLKKRPPGGARQPARPGRTWTPRHHLSWVSLKQCTSAQHPGLAW